jgi:hypothetical protein
MCQYICLLPKSFSCGEAVHLSQALTGRQLRWQHTCCVMRASSLAGGCAGDSCGSEPAVLLLLYFLASLG